MLATDHDVKYSLCRMYRVCATFTVLCRCPGATARGFCTTTPAFVTIWRIVDASYDVFCQRVL